MPRRAIVKKLGLIDESKLKQNPSFSSNRFPLLPTNEMLILFNKSEMERIKQQKIFRISENNYSNVK